MPSGISFNPGPEIVAALERQSAESARLNKSMFWLTVATVALAVVQVALGALPFVIHG